MAAKREPQRAVLFDALDQELRRRPHGTIRAMERALGWAPSWWHNRRRSGDITTRQMLEALSFLEIDPVGFMRRCLEVEQLEIDRPSGPVPDLVARATRRLGLEAQAPGLGLSVIEELDEASYTDPGEALGALEHLIDRATHDEIHRLLVIGGACLTRSVALDEAHHASFTAISESARLGNQRLLGNALRRHVYILKGKGQFRDALAVADRAAGVLLRAGDQRGGAKAQVEQAICLMQLEEDQPSVRLLSAALDGLSEQDPRYFFAAFQAKALTEARLRDFAAAEITIQKAAFWTFAAAPRDRPVIDWTKATILFEQGLFEEAARLMRSVVESNWKYANESTFLTARDLVEALVKARRGAEAFEAAIKALELAERTPLTHKAKEAVSKLRPLRDAALALAHCSLERSR
ncbi:MAG: hypothetical protein KDD11_16935 [Acidobacteria bacterium]|nr:hypothetical protein [Acidobacteriota bacterium]